MPYPRDEKNAKIGYQPDFIAKKGDNIFIIEVKTNTGVINTSEEFQGLIRAKAYGFVPMIVKLKVKLQLILKSKNPRRARNVR